MTIMLKTTSRFLDAVRRDLRRPHAFAGERVGFITTKVARAKERLVLFAQHYHPVADRDYLDDPSVGAMMSADAIRKALDLALLQPLSVFHIHLHDHKGRTGFSTVDRREQLKYVPDFFKVRPTLPHGALVLSADSVHGRAWLDRNTIVDITEFEIAGPYTSVIGSATRRVDLTT